MRHGSTSCTCVSSFNALGNTAAGTVISPVLQMRTLRHSKSAAQLGLESKQSNTRGHTLDYSVSDREIETDRDLGTRQQTDETHIWTERWKQEAGT